MADLKSIDWREFTANASPDDLVSPHFTVRELIRSDVAERDHIDNRFPNDQVARCAVFLAREILEPVRERFGPLKPNSVFRSQQVERALKKMPASWRSTSQHVLGQACDIEVSELSTQQFAEWLRDNLRAYDQIICECFDPAKGPQSGWVHVAVTPPGVENPDAFRVKPENRLLSYVWSSAEGKYVYRPGLTATALA
jgi:hypothetical protein